MYVWVSMAGDSAPHPQAPYASHAAGQQQQQPGHTAAQQRDGPLLVLLSLCCCYCCPQEPFWLSLPNSHLPKRAATQLPSHPIAIPSSPIRILYRSGGIATSPPPPTAYGPWPMAHCPLPATAHCRALRCAGRAAEISDARKLRRSPSFIQCPFFIFWERCPSPATAQLQL